MRLPALTVEQLIEILSELPREQKIVFSDVKYGDFDVIDGDISHLSEDNFVNDRRPILRLRKR
jgi:hypothetical protein